MPRPRWIPTTTEDEATIRTLQRIDTDRRALLDEAHARRVEFLAAVTAARTTGMPVRAAAEATGWSYVYLHKCLSDLNDNSSGDGDGGDGDGCSRNAPL